MSNVVMMKQKLKLLDLKPHQEYVDADNCPFVYMGLARFQKNVGAFEGAADYDGVGVVPLRDDSGPFYER